MTEHTFGQRVRVIYESKERPLLLSGKNAYEISDISQMGLRFFAEGDIKVGRRIRGRIIFLCGESLDVEGMVVRKNRIHVNMNINNHIDKNLLHREQQLISSELNKGRGSFSR